MYLLLPEFKLLLLLLKKHGVNFMLIGGYAVIYYGYERSTNDLDIWLQPQNDNREKLIGALKEFGINKKSLERISLLDFSEVQFFFFGNHPRRIDFLTHISNIAYNEAEAQVNHFVLDEEKIPVIHYDHLILSKISNERTKDKADVEELQRIHRYRQQGGPISKIKNIFRKNKR